MTAIEKLQATLSNGELYLVSSEANRKYLTDFSSSDGFLLISDSFSAFFTDSRYIEAARNTITDCDDVLLLKESYKQVSEYAEKFHPVCVYTEQENLTVSEYTGIGKAFRCTVVSDKLDKELHKLRRIKSIREKERMVKAQRISEGAFSHILTFIRPGVSEIDIRLELEFYMLKNGADGISFDTIAISGKKTSMPHGVPSDKLIEPGDFVTMDYGALVNGYHSDMTRTVAVGSVTDKQVEVYNTVLSAQMKCLEVLRPGVSCRDADAAARDIIDKAGYGACFGHGTGHGVGINIHELPNLSPKSSMVLAEGDIVTDEPGIYLPGEFGVRIEDMVYITSDGYENLTNCDKNLIILQ